MSSGPDLVTLQQARPGVALRVWAWVIFLPLRVVYFFSPQLGVAVNEDAFSAGEGRVSWFVGVPPERLQAMPWVWRLAGRGASVRGELRIREHEFRFVPSAYWRARGANEVLGTIESAVHEQRWSLYTLSDDVCLVRRAYR